MKERIFPKLYVDLTAPVVINKPKTLKPATTTLQTCNRIIKQSLWNIENWQDEWPADAMDSCRAAMHFAEKAKSALRSDEHDPAISYMFEAGRAVERVIHAFPMVDRSPH